MHVIVIAVAVFVSTNIDDLFVLLGLFADSAFAPKQIVIGQYLGLATLVGVGLAASVLALAVSPAAAGLLGVVPIALGLRRFWDRWCKRGRRDGCGDTPPPRSVGRVLAVAALTIANGGDNIGVYGPLFATQSVGERASTVVIFAILTWPWCALAAWLVRHPTLGCPLRQHGPALLPVIWIALGLFILREAGTMALVASWVGR